jgi:hypothetical protein
VGLQALGCLIDAQVGCGVVDDGQRGLTVQPLLWRPGAAACLRIGRAGYGPTNMVGPDLRG